MNYIWNFSNSIGKQRSERLLSVESFELVADQIEHDMSVLCYHLQSCDDDNSYSRPVFCIQLSEDLFDLFFNSPNGYRGAYFSSPFHGLECNQKLIQKISPKLSSWAVDNSPDYNEDFSLQALRRLSAKAWLAETSMELCRACSGEWSHPKNDQPEILNGRWDMGKQPNALIGRKAPLHSKLRVFGAFLNNRRDEFIPVRKWNRHIQIHEEGWS